MKSGLYACAGASATASAAACAKRFDEPITKRSNVYFGLSSTSTSPRAVPWRTHRGAARRPVSSIARRGGAGRALGHREADGGALRARLGCRAHHDVEESALDPVAREVVRDLDDERSR
jgi:hypothetical protein